MRCGLTNSASGSKACLKCITGNETKMKKERERRGTGAEGGDERLGTKGNFTKKWI